MKLVSDALYAFLAGIAISLGATVYLALGRSFAGAVMFSVGLFAICSFGWNLFTGKVCYSIGKGPGYIAFLVVIWLGNFVGTLAAGALMRATRLTNVVEGAVSVTATKLGDGLLSVFILAVFCNVLIYIAVEGYRSIENGLGRYLAIFFGVTVFVACGFEHCVANMYYFTLADVWLMSPAELSELGLGNPYVFILVNTLGNALGGLLIPACKTLSSRLGAKAEVK